MLTLILIIGALIDMMTSCFGLWLARHKYGLRRQKR